MRRLIIMMFLLGMVGACKTTKTVYIPVDQIHKEVTTERDTIVKIHLEQERDSIVSKDTVNVLENKYVRSYVSVKRGYLTHCLETKNVEIPVKVKYLTVTKTDSITNSALQKVETVYVNKLNLMQKIGVWGFYMILASVFGVLVYRLFRGRILSVLLK